MPKGFVQTTVSTSALKLAVPAAASYGVCVLDATNGVRVREDGTAPTASIGVPVAGSGSFYIDGGSFGAAQFIRSGAADAIVNCQFYGP